MVKQIAGVRAVHSDNRNLIIKEVEEYESGGAEGWRSMRVEELRVGGV
jgi:hypothetical protein